MRKLLYIPYNQDGFLPSCSSLPFLPGLQPADIFFIWPQKLLQPLYDSTSARRKQAEFAEKYEKNYEKNLITSCKEKRSAI